MKMLQMLKVASAFGFPSGTDATHYDRLPHYRAIQLPQILVVTACLANAMRPVDAMASYLSIPTAGEYRFSHD